MDERRKALIEEMHIVAKYPHEMQTKWVESLSTEERQILLGYFGEMIDTARAVTDDLRLSLQSTSDAIRHWWKNLPPELKTMIEEPADDEPKPPTGGVGVA